MLRSIAIGVLVTLAGTPALAGGFVGLDLGAGDLDFDDITVAPGIDLALVSDSAATFHVTAGYEFDNGFRVLGGFEEMESIEFLGLGESVELEAFKFGVGFSRVASKRFRVGGTIGMAAWDLKATESALFNPGPEASGRLEDTDIFFDLGIEWVINDTFRMPLTFNHNAYDFGDANIWRIGVRVHFQ